MSFKPKQTNLNNLKHVEVLDVLMGSGKIKGLFLDDERVLKTLHG